MSERLQLALITLVCILVVSAVSYAGIERWYALRSKQACLECIDEFKGRGPCCVVCGRCGRNGGLRNGKGCNDAPSK